jgi:hypothetical protein
MKLPGDHISFKLYADRPSYADVSLDDYFDMLIPVLACVKPFSYHPRYSHYPPFIQSYSRINIAMPYHLFQKYCQVKPLIDYPSVIDI